MSDFEVSFPFLSKARKIFDEKHVNMAQRRTVTALRGKLKTRISRATRGKYNILAAKISQALKVTNKDHGGLRSTTLTYSGNRISLVNFSARFRKVKTVGRRGHLKGVRLSRYGASAKVAKSKRPYLTPGGFIAQGANNNVHIFQRKEKNKSRSKLRLLTGPAVAQMVSDPTVQKDYEGMVNSEFPKVFESKLNHILSRVGS